MHNPPPHPRGLRRHSRLASITCTPGPHDVSDVVADEHRLRTAAGHDIGGETPVPPPCRPDDQKSRAALPALDSLRHVRERDSTDNDAVEEAIDELLLPCAPRRQLGAADGDLLRPSELCCRLHRGSHAHEQHLVLAVEVGKRDGGGGAAAKDSEAGPL